MSFDHFACVSPPRRRHACHTREKRVCAGKPRFYRLASPAPTGDGEDKKAH